MNHPTHFISHRLIIHSKAAAGTALGSAGAHVGSLILIINCVTCLVGDGGTAGRLTSAITTSWGCSSSVLVSLHSPSIIGSSAGSRCCESLLTVAGSVPSPSDLSMPWRSLDSSKLMQRVMEAIACLRATRTSSRPSTCTLSSFSNNLVSLYKNQREHQNGVVNTNEFEITTFHRGIGIHDRDDRHGILRYGEGEFPSRAGSAR